MVAIFETGGKQYKVTEGDVIFVERLEAAEGETVSFDSVLAIVDGGKSKFGTPTVEGAKVTAKVIKNGKSKKIIVYKMKAKKNYRRRHGHRQPYTRLQIETITA